MPLSTKNLFGVCDPWVHELPSDYVTRAISAAADLGCTLAHVRLPGMHLPSSKYPHDTTLRPWWGAGGLQDLWFQNIRGLVKRYNEAGMHVIVSTFDFWAVSHLAGNRDPFTEAAGGIDKAWGRGLTSLQKTYLSKLAGAVSDLDVSWLDGNEGVDDTYPTAEWRASWLSYMRGIGATGFFGHYGHGKPQSGFHFHDVHGDIIGSQGQYLDGTAVVLEEGCKKGPYCSKSICWGGDASEEYYRRCAQTCSSRNVPLCFAYWDWNEFGGAFAPRQLAALKWAVDKGLYKPATPEPEPGPEPEPEPWWVRLWNWIRSLFS